MCDIGYYSLPTDKLHQKPETNRFTNFPASYVGSFYRNLADNVDRFLGSDFYRRTTRDAHIPSEDVQKYILATSGFVKGMQTDINHYVNRDRIDNASFRQKLDPISKNILRRQNRKKNGTDSDLIKNLTNQQCKEFEIRKRLDRLKGAKRFPKDNNNNNNNNNENFLPPVVSVSPP